MVIVDVLSWKRTVVPLRYSKYSIPLSIRINVSRSSYIATNSTSLLDL